MLLCWFYLILLLYEKGPELGTLDSFEAWMRYSQWLATMMVLAHFPYCCAIELSLFRVFRIKRYRDGDQLEEQVEYVYLWSACYLTLSRTNLQFKLKVNPMGEKKSTLLNEVVIPSTVGMNFKYYAQWKKPDIKEHMLYNSIDMKCPKRQVNRERK